MTSKGTSTKLYIGNLPDLCRKEELQAKFEKYGNVVEFDIVSNYGFAHYGSADEARAAADALNGTEYNGNTLRVEISHSRVRQKPGMGEKDGCFRCGQKGHWSKDCPRGPRRPRPVASGYRDQYEDDPYFRDPYADPYYRARYLPPPPPPPAYSHYDPYDPYDRRPLPPLHHDPYMRERYSDPYARPSPDYYARRSSPPNPATNVARDTYDQDPYDPKPGDAFSKDPYGIGKDPYGVGKDPYEDYYERKRLYAAHVWSTPDTKPSTASSNMTSTVSYTSAAQSSRVPGPY